MNDEREDPKTRLIRAGRPVGEAASPVNPPVVRTSTVLFDSMQTMREVRRRRDAGERVFSYGSRGTPTTFALEDAIAELEGGHRTRLFCSGLAAISTVMMTYLRPGEHVLICDSVYEPLRTFCTQFLDGYGIRYTFFNADGSDAEAKIEATTRLIYAECPGSLVYELLDMRALAKVAHARGILLATDNTWGSGYLYRPLELGADISIIAGTKYLGGHSDVMLGAVTTNEQAWSRLADMGLALGQCVSSDDVYLALRGLRTMAARLEMHQRNALEVIEWLIHRPEMRNIYCPALERHPGHDIWTRDFRGTCGLLSIELEKRHAGKVERFIDALQLFGLGTSWGGYESLALQVNVAAARTVTDWSDAGPIVRLHIGLEHPLDLIRDLEQAFAVMW